MRTGPRQQGRYAALSGMTTVQGRDNKYELIVVDRDGRPVPELTEWYRLRRQAGPNRTRDTYLGYLIPVFSYFRDHGWAILGSRNEVRVHILEFMRGPLCVLAHPDRVLEGYTIEATADTPLSESGLRQLRAALRDFYAEMADEGLYHDGNPLDSDLLRQMNRIRAQHVENAGAPDHAGIRGETHYETSARPSSFFRAAHRDLWLPDSRMLMPDALQGLRAALDHMLHLPKRELAERERVVLLLLRYTGARVTEITDMTVGGYRSHLPEGVPFQALI